MNTQSVPTNNVFITIRIGVLIFFAATFSGTASAEDPVAVTNYNTVQLLKVNHPKQRKWFNTCQKKYKNALKAEKKKGWRKTFRKTKKAYCTEYDYTLQATLANNGAVAAYHVKGLVNSNDPTVTILENALDFGEVGPGQSVTPQDTFQVRLNGLTKVETVPFAWQFNYNRKPTASLGSEQNIFVGKTVQLDGNLSSDPDGDSLRYKWTLKARPNESGAVLTNTDQSQSDFTVDKAGSYQIQLIVNDGEFDSTPAEVELTASTPPSSTPSLSLAIIGLGDSILVTDQPTAKIAGVANSSGGVSKVAFLNKTNGQGGIATGTTEWSTNIPLTVGDNKLEFTAYSAYGGYKTSLSTTITYYPGLAFNSPLTLSETIAYVNEDKNVFVKIGLLPSATVKNPAVKLFAADQNGIKGTEIGAMTDDGILPDEIQGDGIYTLQNTLNQGESGYSCYRSEVTPPNDSPYLSETRCVWVTTHYSSDDVNNAVVLANAAETTYQQSLSQGKAQEAAATDAVNALKINPAIGIVASTEDGGVWWVSKAGILGVYHPVIEGQKGGSPRGGPAPTPVLKPEFKVELYPAAYLEDRSQYTPNRPVISQAQKFLASAETKSEIKSIKGIIISPYINNPDDTESSFGNKDDYFVPWKAIKDKNACNLYADKEILNNGSINVSLDSFKALGDYGYIHISTHGDNYFAGISGLWDPAWGPDDWFKGSLSQVVVYTGIVLPMDAENKPIVTGYEDDLKSMNLAISGDGSIVILPRFFKQYLGKLPNSLVVLSACRSMYNNSLANVFLSKGAGAVLGYSDYVRTSYAQNTLKTVVEKLFENKTVKEAFDAAVAPPPAGFGPNDGKPKQPAYFRRTGADDLVLSQGLLQNAGFEEGSLPPWTKSGDGRVIGQLGGATPPEGSHMGIISTGLGYTTQSGQITQNFCATAKAKSLSFDWRFYSEEFKEYCGSIYQDAFVVSMCEIDNANGNEKNCSELLRRKVDDLCGSVSKSDVGFDMGDVYDTGWLGADVDISAFANKHVKLKLFATDVGDSIYDSAILLDDIQVVDEP